MRQEISDDVINPIKRTNHRQHHRSRSLDAYDNLDVLEAQRLFRQKYLQNRAKFESLSNDVTDNGRPMNDGVVSKSRRFSTQVERSNSTVQEPTASIRVRNINDDELRAPSLVRDISAKYVTPVHKSMLETQYKEDQSKTLSNSLPLTALSRSPDSTVHLRRTMSAREGSVQGRYVSRINGIDSLQTRWAQQAVPKDDHFKSANRQFRKHSPSAQFDATNSAVNGAETRPTKWTQRTLSVGEAADRSEFQSPVHYPRKHSPPATTDEVDSGVNRTGTFQIKRTYPTTGVVDVSNKSDLQSPLSYSRVYSLPTIGKESGDNVSKTTEKKQSSIFVNLHRPATSSINTEAPRNQRQDQTEAAITNNTRLIATRGNTQNDFLLPLSTNTRKVDITNESLGSQNGAEISDRSGISSASPRTPLAYSSYKTGLLNKTWNPVPVHRHNSFNDGAIQDIRKTRDYRSISRTKSDVDKYRTIPGTSNQNTFVIDKPQSIRSTLPLTSPPSTKLVVKSRDEILPSTASLKTQFRKFNPPTS